MKMLKRILLAVAICAPVFVGTGCGTKTYVDEQVTVDSTTGTVKSSKDTVVKDQ